jgi:glucoamylase
MARSIVLGNGSFSVCYDFFGQVRDMYFPFVGQENHIGNTLVHKMGVFVKGRLYWFSDPSFSIEIEYAKNTFSAIVRAVHKDIPLSIVCRDVVYNESNIYIRSISLENKGDEDLPLTLFANQQFHISELSYGDTAYYDPDKNALIHYKGRRVFLISARDEEKKYFTQYSVGLLGIEGKEGTWKDAEDGVLSKNGIEHGSVDSVLGQEIVLPAKKTKKVEYWIAVGEKYPEVEGLQIDICAKTPVHMMKTTEDFWTVWAKREESPCATLTERIENLYNVSLFVVKTHSDKRSGAFIASLDSSILQSGRDTYNYCWPRDAAYGVMALLSSLHTNSAKKFFAFASTILTEKGYVLHKYRPDQSLGSSWHPWVRNGVARPPIQEDETAILLIALGEYYSLRKDVEFLEELYNPFVKKIAHFLLSYRDEKTGLPLPSHDLWEEHYTVCTYTVASVYRALLYASEFAHVLGKDDDAFLWEKEALSIKEALKKYLITKEGMILKSVCVENGEVGERNEIVDVSSWYGLFRFGVYEVGDHILEKGLERIQEKLGTGEEKIGIARYEKDLYFATHRTRVGNPWIITTLWCAEYSISRAKNKKDLKEAYRNILWVSERATNAGLFAEQYEPETNEVRSVCPLAWSHAQFLITIKQYQKKLEVLCKEKKEKIRTQICESP